MTAYLRRLRAEIAQAGARYAGWEVASLFLGGGTPSVLPEGAVGALLDAVRGAFDVAAEAEITIECNPGTLTEAKLREYQRAGIRRLSLGLQSVHTEELRLLGRIHSYRQMEENYRAARALGYENINIDLMCALPGQTAERWEETLRRVAALEPEHISAYSLILEEGTELYARYRGAGALEEARRSERAARDASAAVGARRTREAGATVGARRTQEAGASEAVRTTEQTALPRLPDEDKERRLVHRTARVLSEHGYQQYEISNYARAGCECRHNLTYWRRGDYLGLGLGAASCVGERRWKNTSELAAYLGEAAGRGGAETVAEIPEHTDGEAASDTQYIKIPREEEEQLTLEEQRFEAVMLGLRLTEGIDLGAYASRYGERLEHAHAAWLGEMTEAGLFTLVEGRLRLTERGADLLDYALLRYR